MELLNKGPYLSELQDRFIILRTIKYGEADLIIHALSSTGSKRSFIARAALKSKKRFGGGVLEPTHFVQMTFRESRSEGGLNVLNEATLIDDFQSIRLDYDKLEFALFVLRTVDHVCQEGDTDSHFLFNLVGHTLRALGASKNYRRLKLHFCLKLLFQQGVMQVDEWMVPFLKANISESEGLDVDQQIQISINDFLDSIESQVLQYIKTADSEHF